MKPIIFFFFFADIRLKDYGSEVLEVIDNGSGVENNNFQGLSKILIRLYFLINKTLAFLLFNWFFSNWHITD